MNIAGTNSTHSPDKSSNLLHHPLGRSRIKFNQRFDEELVSPAHLDNSPSIKH
jgi:hypothetical protein